jgi:hypothetical protein
MPDFLELSDFHQIGSQTVLTLSKELQISRRKALNVSPPGWFAANPSIVQHNEGYVCILKCINFNLEEIYFSQNWQAMQRSDRLSFRNLMVHLDNDLNVVRITELDESLIKSKFPSISGLEDLRLLFWHGNLWVLGSALEWKFIWSGRMWTHEFAASRMFLSRIENTRLTDSVVFESRANQIVEKNWIAAVDDREALVILPCLGADGRILIPSPDYLTRAEYLGTQFRWSGGWSGSSPLLKIGNQYIAVIHKRTTRHGIYEYSHMFIQTDMDFNVQKRSDMFTFENNPVEYSAGLTLGKDKRSICISYGMMDNTAVVLECRLDNVLGLINVDIHSYSELNALIPDQRSSLSEAQRAAEERTATIWHFWREINKLSVERETLKKTISALNERRRLARLMSWFR